MFELDKTDLEIAIGNLYGQFYRLRKDKRYQEEYDALGTLIDMMSKDRQYLREKYNVEN